MSKRTDKRWEILSKFFTKLKNLSEDETIILMYDSCDMSNYTFHFNDETRYACFEDHMGCIWFVFKECEHFDNESATGLIKRMRERIVACKKTKF